MFLYKYCSKTKNRQLLRLKIKRVIRFKSKQGATGHTQHSENRARKNNNLVTTD